MKYLTTEFLWCLIISFILILLTLDSSNAEKLRKIFPARQNSIVCSICQRDSLIQSSIEGLDISFRMECEHKHDLMAPFLTLNNRVLPDINMIVSKSVSSLANLGFLTGAEIVFPEVILDVIDVFKKTGKKKASNISEEKADELADKAGHVKKQRVTGKYKPARRGKG